MSNVLIAIVSEAYEKCMATAYDIYWSIYLNQVTETEMVFPYLPHMLKRQPDCMIDTVLEMVKEEAIYGDRARQELEERTNEMSFRVNKYTESRTNDIGDQLDKLSLGQLKLQNRMEEVEAVLTTSADDLVLEGGPDFLNGIYKPDGQYDGEIHYVKNGIPYNTDVDGHENWQIWHARGNWWIGYTGHYWYSNDSTDGVLTGTWNPLKGDPPIVLRGAGAGTTSAAAV